MSIELAHALSGSETACPVPSAHDKANEAHYFLHEMMEHYHECDRFRWSLSAFFQAARGITLLLQADLAGRDGFAGWYLPWREKMAGNADLRLLNSERVRVVHQEALVPASSMFFGAFELGRQRLGFSGVPLHPMRDSVSALIESRARYEKGIANRAFLHPYRMSNCEEYGLTRTWSLPDLNGVELVDFCAKAFASILEVLSAAHEWCGASYNPKVTCHHGGTEYRSLRESQIFPEVARAWGSEPTERVLPREKTLPLRVFPSDDAEILYVVTPKRIARGWVSSRISSYWPTYASMLVYSFARRRLKLRNSVFFDRSHARIEPARTARY